MFTALDSPTRLNPLLYHIRMFIVALVIISKQNQNKTSNNRELWCITMQSQMDSKAAVQKNGWVCVLLWDSPQDASEMSKVLEPANRCPWAKSGFVPCVCVACNLRMVFMF